MKSQKVTLLFSLLLIFLMTFSCTRFFDNSERPSVLPQTSNNQPERIATSTPIDVQVSSTTQTAAPTLSEVESRAKLLNLLSTNGGCQLPCFWDITPGKSSFKSAEMTVLPFIKMSSFTDLNLSPGVISPMFSEEDQILDTRIAYYYDDDGIVYRISFYAGEVRSVLTNSGAGIEPIFDSAVFGERLKYYMLQQVLTQQGIPTVVMLAPHGGVAGFGILVLYPEKGILIDYSAQMYSVDSGIRGCPLNAHVEMELYPPGTSDSFYDYLRQTDWSVRLNYYKPLEEVTTMSLEEFYQVFSQPTENCIETPAKYWPTPVP